MNTNMERDIHIIYLEKMIIEILHLLNVFENSVPIKYINDYKINRQGLV